MPPRLSLKSFLSSARAALTSPAPRTTPLTLVIGNESADLDSLCSAIVCAYLRSHTPPHALHVPLANLPRADLPLRTEMTAVLAHAGLSPSDILTLSDLPTPSPDAGSTIPPPHWFLVDHNALTGTLRAFQGDVVGVVDHHVDEHATPESVSPRIVEPCGSCASLVIAEYADTWDRLSSGIDHFEGQSQGDDSRDYQDGKVNGHANGEAINIREEDEKLAMLSLAPILVDTINLTDASKVTPKDLLALDFLRGKISTSFLQTSFFDEITAVKDDLSALSLRDILRKDYKEWHEHGLTLGISAIVQNLDYLLAKGACCSVSADADTDAVAAQSESNFLHAVKAWAGERGLDLASVMTVSSAGNPGGEFQRHLLAWGVTERGRRAARRFEEGLGRGLRLETWRGGLLDGEGRRAWRQMELTASRKQVAPLLREALKEV